MKRLFATIICIISVSLAALPMVSCGNNDPLGTFYTLQGGYDLGIIDKGDLQEIAEYLKSDTNLIDKLDINVKSLIQKTAITDYYKSIDTDFRDITEEAIKIVRFFGEYNGAYAVTLINEAVQMGLIKTYDRKVTIENITFNYTNELDIYIWKKQ